MASNSAGGAEVVCDGVAQEIDRGEARVLVIDKKPGDSPNAKGTRSSIVEGDTGGGIELGSKPNTNSGTVLASAEMGSHNEIAGASSADGTAGLVPANEFGKVDTDYYAHLIPAHEDPQGDCVLKHKLRQQTKYVADVDSRGKLLSDVREYRMALLVGLQILVRVQNFNSEAEAKEFVYQCHDGGRNYTPAELRTMRHNRVGNLLSIPGMTYAEIARRTGMDESSIRKIRNRNFPDMEKKDGRRRYNEDLEREAVRLVKQGDSYAEVARKTLMHPKAVQRAESRNKSLESRTDAAKRGKKAKPIVDSCVLQVPKATDGGIPELHRLAIEHLGTESEDYVARCSTAYAQARKDLEANSNDVNALLTFSLYGSQLTAIANQHLENFLSAVGGGTVQEGTVLRIEPDHVHVELDDGRAGVVRKSEINLMMYGPFELGARRRFRETGRDTGDGSLDLQPLGQQTSYRATDVITAKTDLDERWSPFGEVASLKAGPKKKRMRK